ncbi:SDR family NAD(P)-dependent oxidoreductase [Alteribacillus sp. YIM 98480]|uniref:SDR family NAD(P)-dependent oxidoreductase n=1 Tax=Alteribacillus sp. YIM 98480 TaxID=2606599 RepID=UPI0018EEE598|nr:glucose 1-dehydrogenase [Alteribacillus sp. YIM 98480]
MEGLKDKVAIVTGAAGGLGTNICRTLAEKGIHIVMADNSSALQEEFKKFKNEFPDNQGFSFKTDVTKEEDVQNLVEETVKKFNKLDIMANNAGVVQDMYEVADTPIDVFDKVLNVNLKGVFLGSKHAAKQMKQQQFGTIVNTGSFYGKTGQKQFSCYCASKAAVINFTQSLALELADYKVTANSVSPGNMATEMHWKALRNEAEIREISFEEMKEKVIETIPLRRHGTGEDIAGAILYLASEHGSYVTGQALNVNGGVELH